MSGPHFFVEQARDLRADDRVTLSPQDSRHALRSLRIRIGEAVTVSNDAGLVGTGTMAGEEEGRAVIHVASVHRVVRRGTMVSVALAPPKGDRLGWAVQKLAELGVEEIVPLRTERGVRAWHAERSQRAVAKVQAAAREAAMQSRQPFVSTVLDTLSVDDALGVRAHLVVLDPGGEQMTSVLPEEAPSAVRLLVGPEGGFTDVELARASDAGGHLAALGDSILRTETAAVIGAALVLHRYGRLG